MDAHHAEEGIGMHRDPLAFYSAAATVIPVLFLALIYKRGCLSARRWAEPRRARTCHRGFVGGVA